jgi:hypothetical protein
MPAIIVYGVPNSVPEERIKEIIGDYQGLVSGIEALKLKPKQISVFFQKGRASERLSEESIIIILVLGLYSGPGRTNKVFERLKKNLEYRTKRFYFPDASTECFVEPIDPKLCQS